MASSAIGHGNPETDRDLVASVCGMQASRDNAVANRTRRVVLASLGVLKEQKTGSKRSRGVALAVLLMVVLSIGPSVWCVVDDLISGEHLCDVATQFSMLFCVFCPAIAAAVLVAGWARGRF